MPMSSKFLTESTGEKIVKIGQYLAKLWTTYDSLLFFGPPCTYSPRRETQYGRKSSAVRVHLVVTRISVNLCIGYF